MSVRLREAEAQAELRETRQRMLELETQVGRLDLDLTLKDLFTTGTITIVTIVIYVALNDLTQVTPHHKVNDIANRGRYLLDHFQGDLI